MSEEPQAASPVPVTDPDFAFEEVPMANRKGFWGMFVIMLGFTFFSASMWVGSTLGHGMTLGRLLLSLLSGNLILGVYTSALAYMGSHTGLSVHLLSRYTFGRRGSWLPSVLLAVTQIGWFGVGVAMFSIPTTVFLKGVESLQGCWLLSGPLMDVWGENALPIRCLFILTAVSGLAFTSSAYFGIRALTIVSFVAVPAVAVFGCYSAIKVFADDPNAWQTMKAFTPSAESYLTFSAAVALTVGSFISGGTCTPDFVRFAKSKGIAVSTTAIAFFIGNSLMFIFGAVGGMFYDTNDISVVLVRQGLLAIGIIVLGLNIWTTNDNALYTSGLGLSNITGFPKRFMVLFNGLLGTLLAIYLYDNFCGYLNMLNTTLPSIGAVLMADFFVVRRQRYEAEAEKGACQVKWKAVVAWACGVAVANFVPTGISSINGILVAFVVYSLLNGILCGSSCNCGCHKN